MMLRVSFLVYYFIDTIFFLVSCAGQPSLKPSGSPTLNPPMTPTHIPSIETYLPSDMPSSFPSDNPSMVPTMAPSYLKPTSGANGNIDDQKSVPTSIPSDVPSFFPTIVHDDTDIDDGEAQPPLTGSIITFGKCFDDLSEIYLLEKHFEDSSILRKYVLCPDTLFEIGRIDEDGNIVDGQQTIQLRPNVIYQCGDDGNRLNGCLIRGGDFGLTSFYGVYESIYETVENVLIKGLTFQSQTLFAAVLEAAGDVTFDNCEFSNQGNMVPIVLQWKGDGPHQSSPVDSDVQIATATDKTGNRLLRKDVEGNQLTTAQFFYLDHSKRLHEPSGRARKLPEVEDLTISHKVVFKKCIFRDNFAVGRLAFPGIIENTYFSSLEIHSCLFENNEYGDENNPTPFGYAIRSFGPLKITDSCFVDNTFFKFAPVQVLGAAVDASNNYGYPSIQRDLTCDFIASFQSEDAFQNGTPNCFGYDANECSFSLSSGPTMPPVLPAPAPVGSSSNPASACLVCAVSSTLNFVIMLASLFGLVHFYLS